MTYPHHCVGFLLPLSGGADSAAVAAIVHVMSVLVSSAVRDGNEQVLSDLQHLLSRSEGRATEDVSTDDISPALITGTVLHTIYMGTSNSTDATRLRSEALARDISSYHSWFSIDLVVDAVVSVFSTLSQRTPKYLSQGDGRLFYFFDACLTLEQVEVPGRTLLCRISKRVCAW